MSWRLCSSTGPQKLAPTGAQIAEVAFGDQRAGQVVVTLDGADLMLDERQASAAKAVLPQSSRDGQQVQVSGQRRRTAAMHPMARDDQRPVECPAVVGHQPRVGRQIRAEHVEQCDLSRVVRKHELRDRVSIALPGSDSDQESKRP